MFAGHVGAALAIGRADRRVNVGAFIFAAFLLDVLLWFLVLVDREFATIPANFAETHQPVFVFPYSHGLLGSIVWSILAGAAVFLWYPRLADRKLRAAALIAAAVFSHWLLDALVHGADLPLAGAGSPKVGLGLWQSLPVALAVEAFVLVAGLGLFLPGAQLSRGRRLWLSVLVLVVLGSTLAGMTVAPPPPSAAAMAGSSLVTIAVLCALVFGIDRRPSSG